ncbi:hypothetical protein CQW23_35346 [Capsicum baccatum]|uniref:Uncharacterized protein n=1 Tax=Capsicum baccatum TaxID=33114 RepID=A0A2G2UW75_CAPBA|nr:hypothetical protein CQW23_35346 [Capsicum baccatum]
MPRCLGAMVPWCLGDMEPWCQAALVPWCHGATVPWGHGAAPPWCHGAKEPWCLGATVPRRDGFDNDPSAGSPTETLLRFLLHLNDKVQWTSRDVAGSEPPTSPRYKHFTGSFNR